MVLRRVLLFLAIALLAGCAVLPPRSEERPSEVVRQPSGTRLWAQSGHLARNHESAFGLVPGPRQALEQRLRLIGMADRTLDLQYYIWSADRTGMLLLRALRDAAQRGVRVRLLLDDLNLSGVDELLQAFSGFDNVEVRLFNPFPSGRASLVGRLLGSLADLRRVGRRMHNKLLVADDIVAVAGGRNIGDAYLTEGERNFVDVDVVAAGSVVADMSDSFDDYWNSGLAYDGASIWGRGDKAAQRAGFERLTASVAPVDAGPAGLPFPGPLETCPARFFGDPVEKADGVDTTESGESIYRRLLLLFEKSRTEIFVASPYFVRGEQGLRRIRSLVDRGVRVRVLTNSLSTTDVIAAHAAYLRHRAGLVALGVDLRELAPRGRPGESHAGFGSGGKLHAKIAVVDRRWLYVGSFNFTARSESLNTEAGLILDCPRLAGEVIRILELAPAYELRPGAAPRSIEWVRRVPGEDDRVWASEPGASIWQLLGATLLSAVVPEQEL